MTSTAPRVQPRRAQASRLRERGLSAAAGVIAGLTIWLLAATRWGSYFSVPGVHAYVSDYAIGAALLIVVLTGSVLVAVKRIPWRRPVTVLLLLLLIWSLVRLLLGGEFDQTALRDFAPYGYAVCGLLMCAAPVRTTVRWRLALVVGLAFHAAWMTFSALAPQTVATFPTLGNTQWLAIRYDVDAAVCGVAAALAVLVVPLRRPGRRAAAIAAFGIWNVILAVTSTSRSGLLACLTVVAFAAAARAFGNWHSIRSPRPALAGGIVAAALAVVALILASPSGQRLLESGTAGSGSAGTTHARRVVYDKVVHYITAKPERVAIGTGFGPDFLARSHAAFFLEGTEYTGVRSPHDYELGTWARTGIPGLALTAALSVLGVVAGWRRLRSPRRDLWGDCCALLALALPLVAAFGVVLESPFGAIPWFVALGQLAAAAETEPAAAPAP